MDTSIFYNARDILSYKRLYNVIMGVRGHGKTYDSTKKCISIGIQQKKVSFVILVRYKEDIKNIKDSWWELVADQFPEYTFFSKGRVFYAKNELETFPIGEIVALNEYTRAKRVPRPYVKYIVFDEFLNEDNDYLNDEVTKFLSVCDSIIRLREDVRVLLITNHVTSLNPYFDYFGFKRLPEKRFLKGEHNSILEFTDSDEFIKYRETTKFGSSVKGTKYGSFALEGKFLLDDNTNVYPNPTGKFNYLYNIVLEGLNISVYMVSGLMFFDECKDMTRLSYTPYVDDAKVYGATFCDKGFKYFQHINKYFMRDEVMFSSLKVKNTIIEFIRFLMGNRYK